MAISLEDERNPTVDSLLVDESMRTRDLLFNKLFQKKETLLVQICTSDIRYGEAFSRILSDTCEKAKSSVTGSNFQIQWRNIRSEANPFGTYGQFWLVEWVKKEE